MSYNYIGIDLGTSNSVCAVMEDGKAHFLTFEDQEELLPSCFMYYEKRLFIGSKAKRRSEMYPENYISSSKTMMGTNKVWTIDGKDFTPVDVAVEILKKIRRTADQYFGNDLPIKACVTVPAYFNDTQRKDTERAARMAGFAEVRLLNEPVAAAIAYGVGETQDKTYFVLDLGGGTSDIAMLHGCAFRYEAKIAHEGDTDLGGDKYTEILENRIYNYVLNETGIDLGGEYPKDQTDYPISRKEFYSAKQKVKREAERAKLILSGQKNPDEKIKIFILNLFIQNGEAAQVEMALSRKEFEQDARKVTRKLERLLDRAIRDNNINENSFEEIILAGGTTNLPVIRELLQKRWNKPLRENLDKARVVALGAAVFASKWDDLGESGGLVIEDVLAHSLGIKLANGTMGVFFSRGVKYPAERTQSRYSTTKDNQESITIRVFSGEYTQQADHESNVFLGAFTLNNLEKAPKGVPDIDITFKIDKNGILRVEARDTRSGSANSKEFTEMEWRRGTRQS